LQNRAYDPATVEHQVPELRSPGRDLFSGHCIRRLHISRPLVLNQQDVLKLMIEGLMAKKERTTSASKTNGVSPEKWPGIDAKFRLINLAALRTKQLLRGAHPRIEPDPLRHKNTSIALEELKRGLVTFAPAEVE